MAAKIQDLQFEYDTLKTRRDAIDLDALHAAHAAAQQAGMAYQPPRAHFVDAEEDRLSLAVGTAKIQLNTALSTVAELNRRMAPLHSMLTSGARLAATVADLDVHRERVAATAAGVTEAQKTCDTLAALLADATVAFSADGETVARELLTAAKSGHASKAGAPDRSRLDAIEAALAMAQGELAEAQAAHAAAVTAHAEALRENELARADVSTLALELATRDYAVVVVKHRAIVGADFEPADDLMMHVYRLESETQ